MKDVFFFVVAVDVSAVVTTLPFDDVTIRADVASSNFL
jgi:hypothetical protein